MQLNEIKGLGEKRVEKLASCGIYDPLDLLLLFPSLYYDRRRCIDWSSVSDGEEIVFKGKLTGKPAFKRVRKGLSFVKAVFESAGVNITCTWFNQDYVYRQLIAGSDDRLVWGKVKRSGRNFEIVSPKLLTPRDTDVMPIYKLPKGLTQAVMYDAVKCILTRLNIKGYISASTAAAHGLLPLGEALKGVHFPMEAETASIACRSVALENLTYTLSAYNILRVGGADRRARFYDGDKDKIASAIASLPFRLTDDQFAAITGIVSELKSDSRANILLQGDVGSGKTIVAFLAMYYAVISGYQAAIMAPTEILANQHFESACNFFQPLGVSVARLLGSMTAAEKRLVLSGVRSGEIQVLVGTHAIIGKGVEFADLGLTVTDEQHRFGVCQRGSLENKSENADNIVMSATPIPRTLALTLYGQLTSIVLSSRPSGANNTITAIVPDAKLEGMYKYIRERAAAGEKTYIVCPRIDSDDDISVKSIYNEMRQGALKDLKLALLHGGQKENEKSAVMKNFAVGDTDVLVSTTVIEVGIDVKSATTMIIYGAERFGLSQLHQLRGRVGRDGRTSYCFIVGSAAISERLRFFCECSDGFRLAEYDFDRRGAGDFLGTRQHGRENAFAGVRIDAEMIRTAKSISDELLSDPITAKAIAASAESKSEFIRSLSLN